jgi:hypothetical protein
MNNNDLNKVFKQLLSTIDILKYISDVFIENKFPITERLNFNSENIEIIDINKCEFILSDLIIYISNLSIEYLNTFSKKKSLKDDLLSFLSKNIALNKKYENVAYQVDRIYFVVAEYFNMLDIWTNMLNKKLSK